VVVKQRRDPRRKTEPRGVLLELFPEDAFRFFLRKRRKSIPTSRGDEVDLIVTVPVLEAMLSVVVLS
jgi:hypothetical protein